MQFRESLAKAITSHLLNNLTYDVYLQEADDNATAPYIVYSMITGGIKTMPFKKMRQ